MIYDKLTEIARYRRLFKNLDSVVSFLRSTDLTALPMGRTNLLDSDIYCNRFTYTTAILSQVPLFEAHERYLDLHIVLSGSEQIAMAPVGVLDEVEIRADEDSILYRGAPEYTLPLDTNRFLLVFPGEGHLPKLVAKAQTDIDKLVIKIAY